MSLDRVNSRNNIFESNQKDQTQTKEIETNATNSTPSVTTKQSDEKTQEKTTPPKMKLQISTNSSSTDSEKKTLSPRAIPQSPRSFKSPRITKEKSETTSDHNLFNDKQASQQSESKSASPEKDKDSEKNSSSSTKIISSDANEFQSTPPAFQIRRLNLQIPTKYLKEDHEADITTITESPVSTNLMSPITAEIKPVIHVTEKTTTVKESSDALVELILKQYEDKPLSPDTIKVLGREDIYYPVVRLPKTLTHLCDFPDKGITSISELLQKLFGEELSKSPAWKKAEAALKKGLSFEDGSVEFGETDVEVMKKYAALLMPLALTIAESILGKNGKMHETSLPVEFINLLFQSDKKLLEICMDSKKLRIKDVNNARLHFIFNLVVTRFLQVLVMKNISERPSQVETWFMSGILNAFGSCITSLFDDFMTQSGSTMSKNLIEKFDAKVNAEIREDEAIKKFKQIELTKNRINELKKKDAQRIQDRSRGHSRATSNIDLAGIKFARDNNKKLNNIKSECGFDEMDDKFIHYIETHQKTWFHANEKNTSGHILVSLKVAVREFIETQVSEKSSLDESLQKILRNLDERINAEYVVKRNRRTTAYNKDIKFSVSTVNSSESKETTASTSTSTSTSTTTATSSTATTSDNTATSTDSGSSSSSSPNNT